MAGRKTVTVSFNAVVSLEKREDRWAAYIEPTGMTVYGHTREEAERRVKEGLDFFLKHVPDVRKYLDSHGIPHYITEDDDSMPIRHTYPVSARVESPVYV